MGQIFVALSEYLIFICIFKRKKKAILTSQEPCLVFLVHDVNVGRENNGVKQFLKEHTNFCKENHLN